MHSWPPQQLTPSARSVHLLLHALVKCVGVMHDTCSPSESGQLVAPAVCTKWPIQEKTAHDMVTIVNPGVLFY